MSLFYSLQLILWLYDHERADPSKLISLQLFHHKLKFCYLKEKVKSMSCDNLPVESENVLLKYTACIHLYLFALTVLGKINLQGFLS